MNRKSRVSEQRGPDLELRLRKEELEENPTARVPVCLVLDVSQSMSYDRKLDELNTGVERFYAAIRKDELASVAAEIAVVTFGHQVDVVSEFRGIDRQQVPRLVAGGNTPMGEAVMTALDLLETAKGDYSIMGVDYFQPWLVLMTDGAPTDDISRSVERCRELLSAKPRKLTVFPVAIGGDAKIETLRQFAPHLEPLQVAGADFSRFFDWLAMSVKTVSLSNPGDTASTSLGEREFTRLSASWNDVMKY